MSPVLARLRTGAREALERADDRWREAWNAVRFGRLGPRVRERLWIDPAQVHGATLWFPAKSAQVVRHWPPAPVVPFEEHPHVAYALAHWRDGVPWEQTGALEYMQQQIARRGSQDGCRDVDEVRLRFARLDELHATVGRERRLRPRQQVDPAAFREAGGILVHLGPGGEVLAGDGGKHRLTIARLHGLAVVPVQVGVVHRSALPLVPLLRHAPPQAGWPTLDR